MPEHQPAHRGHGVVAGLVVAGREDGRPAPQQLPALAAQDLAQVLDIALDRFHVGIPAPEEDFQVAVGCTEIPIEPLSSHLRHELRVWRSRSSPEAYFTRGLPWLKGRATPPSTNSAYSRPRHFSR